MLKNLFAFKKNRVKNKLFQCSSEYVTHIGMYYIRDIFTEELRYNEYIKDKELALKQCRILKDSGARNTAIAISQISEQFPDIYNGVLDLCPMIIDNIVSVTNEAENLSAMLASTQRFHPERPVFSKKEWMEQLASPKARLDALLEAYPRETTTIFQVFSGSQNMEYPSYDVVYRASFNEYMFLIAIRGDNQYPFINEMSNFLKAVEVLKS